MHHGPAPHPRALRGRRSVHVRPSMRPPPGGRILGTKGTPTIQEHEGRSQNLPLLSKIFPSLPSTSVNTWPLAGQICQQCDQRHRTPRGLPPLLEGKAAPEGAGEVSNLRQRSWRARELPPTHPIPPPGQQVHPALQGSLTLRRRFNLKADVPAGQTRLVRLREARSRLPTQLHVALPLAPLPSTWGQRPSHSPASWGGPFRVLSILTHVPGAVSVL